MDWTGLNWTVRAQRVYGVRKVQMLLPGRCVSADALVRQHDATTVAPTQKEKLFSRHQFQIC
jgi:hypothetical protein